MIKKYCDICNQEINAKALNYSVQVNCRNNDNRNILMCENCYSEITEKIASFFKFKKFNYHSIKEIITKYEKEK